MSSEKPDRRRKSAHHGRIRWLWWGLVGLWAAFVYVLFFLSFITDYLARRGGG
jgi:hypothetical protein